jgi:hypothetical protein
MKLSFNNSQEAFLVVPSRKEAKKIALLFGVLLLFCMVICSIGVRAYSRQHFIDTHGVVTQGAVESVVYRHGFKGGGGYIVYYSFDCNGVTYQGSSAARTAWTPPAAPAIPIRVKYIPDNPTLNWPPDIGVSNSLFLATLPLWMGLALFGFLIIAVLRAPVAQNIAKDKINYEDEPA